MNFSSLPRRSYPCHECPFRRDVPAKFTVQRFAALRSTSEQPDPPLPRDFLQQPMFACHLGSPGSGEDLACAGWLATSAENNLAVRHSLSTGRLPFESLRPGSGWPPLFGSYEEMALLHSAGPDGAPLLNTDPGAFRSLFENFTSSAFRLETRTAYGVPEEDEPFHTWLSGEDPGTAWLQDWLDLMTAQTGNGRTVRRVRVVDHPPSDYLRFEISVTPHNLAAGEVIRYLPRQRSDELQLPGSEFWIFDRRLLVFLAFGTDDQFLGFASTDDPAAVSRHERIQQHAWSEALPYEQYVSEQLTDLTPYDTAAGG
ncbi:DUF6879 family protein [Streptomyces sp. TR02-1]|uniref:DUF6879 family protein n=1 Tax=Streptomyces sp. TR02-1 TaxID=3385977 RepID=UPI0039A1E638